MGKEEIDFLVEKKRLEETICLAKKQLEGAKNENEKTKEAILEAKKELRENTEHSIGNLWSSDGFEALAELSQYANPVTEKLVSYEETQNKILSLEKLIKSPYFARIDFKFEEEDTFEKIYIGLTSLKDQESREIYIYDWRSPIASVFYRFVLGAAYYDAPSGRFYGEVNLKRQYEIENGKLCYFFDADVQIVDEFLKKMLSQNTSPKMKTIVETIQRDQDLIIRDMESDLMMVQGVAGSGKTSVALHRAAYLMYQGLSAKLSANDILIISPNTLFEQYISEVLPELGENHATSATFEELFRNICQITQLQPRSKFLEKLIENLENHQLMKQSMELKTSLTCKDKLDVFVEEIPKRVIAFEDVYFEGKLIEKKETLRARVMGKDEVPLGARLKLLEKYVIGRINDTRKRRLSKTEESLLKQELEKMTSLNVIECYKQFFESPEYSLSFSKQEAAGMKAAKIVAYTRENLEDSLLHYDDAVAIFYLHLKVYGTGMYRNIKQVVIDEAQDYYPLQFEIFHLLFPEAKFTILGDRNQTLEKEEDASFYEKIAGILKKKKASLLTMDKSFRCTNEILHYSLGFIEETQKIESFNRNGEEPQVYVAEDQEDFNQKIVEEVRVCRECGYKTIGLLCKTAKNARFLHSYLKKEMEVQLIENERKVELNGVVIIPVYMSKGLEFDAVLICDADEETYVSHDDKKLLYIECTRALHRLNLFCVGAQSPLLER